MIIHSLAGCQLKCYGCHNYNELVVKEQTEYYDHIDILKQIEYNGYLFDAIIFSGGEFLLERITEIESLLLSVRKRFDGIVVINTNGLEYEKIKYILNNKLVDGIHIDFKLPYHLLNKSDEDIYKIILGNKNVDHINSNCLASVKKVLKNNSMFSQIRTVKYPLLDESYFKEIEIYVKELKEKYNSNVEYKINKFMDV